MHWPRVITWSRNLASAALLAMLAGCGPSVEVQSNTAPGLQAHPALLVVVDATSLLPPLYHDLRALLGSCGIEVRVQETPRPAGATADTPLRVGIPAPVPGRTVAVLTMQRITTKLINGAAVDATFLLIVHDVPAGAVVWKAQVEVRSLRNASKLFARKVVDRLAADGIIAVCTGAPA